MTSVFGIFKYKNTLRNQSSAINHFIGESGQTRTIQKEFPNLTIIIKSNQSDEPVYVENEELFSCFSGYLYPDKLPECNNSEINKSRFKSIVNAYNATNRLPEQEFRGFYNAVFYNKTQSQLTIINDKLGLNVLYTYEDEGVFAFCNEYQPLILMNESNNIFNCDAISEYLVFGNTLNDKTLMNKIDILPAYSSLHLKSNSHNSHLKRYSLPIDSSSIEVEELAEIYSKTFKRELNLFLKWYPDIDITLTGGTDTRLILASMDEEERRKRKYVTIRNSFIHDSENEDIVIARKLAQKFNLNHEVVNHAKYAPEKASFDIFDFKNASNFVTGYLGSETLRFPSSYPNNINEISRKIIANHKQYSNKFAGYFEKLKTRIGINGQNNQFEDILAGKIRVNKYELYATISYISSPYNEAAYIFNVLSRSFFTRINGGYIGSQMMPTELLKNLFTPYALPQLSSLIFGANPSVLINTASGLTNNIFKFVPKEFLEVESNSHIANNENTLLKKGAVNKHVTVFRKPNYEICNDTEFKKFVNDVFPAKYEIVFSGGIDNLNNKDTHIWADLLLFFYVNSLK